MTPWRIPQHDLVGWIKSRSSELWAVVMDAVDDMIFVKSPEGTFVYNNASHLAFLGRSREAVTNCSFQFGGSRGALRLRHVVALPCGQ